MSLLISKIFGTRSVGWCSFFNTYFLLLLLVCRGLADNTTDVEDKQHFLLEGLSQLQLAVSQQEHVVLNAQTLLPSESAVGTVNKDG